MKKTNMVLIGLTGCGKTTVGAELAKRLQYGYIDSDVKIVQETQMEITDIFAQFGEAHFRKLEQAAIAEIAKLQRYIISPGGGVVKSEENMRRLLASSLVVFLQATPEKLYENTKTDFSRPLLNTPNRFETIQQLLAERAHLYQKYAEITVDTSEILVPEVADRILQAATDRGFFSEE